jgi:Cu(I)/Ag(I) efflux system membrane protein CusA/SilA
MKRIAAPMVGGIFTSFVLELLVYPAIYEVWKWNSFPKSVSASQVSESLELQTGAGLTGSRPIWEAHIPPQESPSGQ